MRKCGTCKKYKKLIEFAFKYKRKNIRHHKCKSCQKKYNKKYFNGEIKGMHGNIGKKRPTHSKRMKGKGNPIYGKHRSKKVKEKISKTRIKRNYSGKNHPNYGKKIPKLSAIMKKRWRNKEFRNKRIKATLNGLKKKINKPEQKLLNILKTLFKNKYMFVGDGQFILDGFNPDFISKDKTKIIELYGDYWHNLKLWKERDKRRHKSYLSNGYKFLIVWEHELNDLDKLVGKLIYFNKGD